jgi:hypothetical protein
MRPLESAKLLVPGPFNTTFTYQPKCWLPIVLFTVVLAGKAKGSHHSMIRKCGPDASPVTANNEQLPKTKLARINAVKTIATACAPMRYGGAVSVVGTGRH